MPVMPVKSAAGDGIGKTKQKRAKSGSFRVVEGSRIRFTRLLVGAATMCQTA